MNSKPYVSVIVPCRNERAFIKKCLLSIIRNDYPPDRLEILVIDGMSEDGTREIIKETARHNPSIKLVDNPKKIIPAALNIGIKASKGELIVRMDAHSVYKKNYISSCVTYLKKYNADAVGGILRATPPVNTLPALAISRSLSHPFGVGNSFFRLYSKEVRGVDTIACGCYKKEVFQKIEFFNERLVRSEDIDFNLRLKRAGGKIILFPRILADYYTDATLLTFLAHNFNDGVWVTYPLAFTNIILKPRHLAPLVFVSLLLLLLLLSAITSLFFSLFILVLSIYLIAVFVASSHIAWKEKNMSYTFIMPFVFIIRHLAYGGGSFWGLIKIIPRMIKGKEEREKAYVPRPLPPDSMPFVSIIIPCRNERHFIEQCLRSIIQNTYPKKNLEILVVDGMSEDGTREIIDTYGKRYPFITRIDNEKKIIPCGMNLGIAHAKGKIFIKMDAHSTYEKDYISRCVYYLQTYDVDNVGGIVVPRPGNNSLRARVIASSLSHPFGVGTSPFRRIVTSREPRLVDTVAFGCYKREVFKKIGPYNESLIRSSDMELNLRLKRAGGKTLLVPDIIAYYYANTTFLSFWKHNVYDGIWALLPIRYTKTPLLFRHYMPLGLISILLLLLVLSFAHALLFSILISILILYFGVAIIAALSVAIRKKDIRYVFFMPLVFVIRHFAYGLGSLWGIVKLAF